MDDVESLPGCPPEGCLLGIRQVYHTLDSFLSDSKGFGVSAEAGVAECVHHCLDNGSQHEPYFFLEVVRMPASNGNPLDDYYVLVIAYVCSKPVFWVVGGGENAEVWKPLVLKLAKMGDVKSSMAMNWVNMPSADQVIWMTLWVYTRLAATLCQGAKLCEDLVDETLFEQLAESRHIVPSLWPGIVRTIAWYNDRRRYCARAINVKVERTTPCTPLMLIVSWI